MSSKQLLFFLAWVVPLVLGVISLGVVVFARRSLRAAHQSAPAWLLHATALMLLGLGSLLFNYGYTWASALGMLLAALLMFIGIVLMLLRW